MKKLLILTLAVIVAIGLASCTQEPFVDVDEGASLTFSFVIDNPANAPTTYATANDREKEMRKFDIYIFDNEGVFQNVFYEHEREISINGSVITAKMSQYWIERNLNSTFRFYFVANDAVHTSDKIAARFDGNEEDFKMLLTRKLPESHSSLNKYRHIDPPFFFSAVSSLITVSNEHVTENLKLKRREARFDIVNAVGPEFSINSIRIKDTNRQAYAFADAELLLDRYPFEKVTMDDIIGPLHYVTENNEDIAKSVFYLFPTKNETVNISIMASLDNGPEKEYNLSLDLIEANKRYKLVARPNITGTRSGVIFSIVATDYDEGGSMNIEHRASNSLNVSIFNSTMPIPVEFGGGFDGMAFYFNQNIPGTLSFIANSRLGTRAEIIYIAGSVSDFTTPLSVTQTSRTTDENDSHALLETYDIVVPQSNLDGPFVIEVKFMTTAGSSITNGGFLPNSQSIYFIRFNNKVVPEGILCVNENGVLNLDGDGTPLYFKWGSLLGLEKGVTFEDIFDYEGTFDFESVLWMPAGFDLPNFISETISSSMYGTAGYKDIPYQQIGNNAFPEVNEAAGLGDPCLFASKNGTGVGSYRMPKGDPYESFSGAVWDNTKLGYHSDQGQFYPFIGHIDRYGQLVNYGLIGTYWSSLAPDYYGGYVNKGTTLMLSPYSAYNNYTMERETAVPVRCVPK